MLEKDTDKTSDGTPQAILWQNVTQKFGVLPNFFRLAPNNPAITANLFGFADFAYLDSPLPSLFKERLFVYLSRFCEVRYCIVRHVGFLLGYGHAAGDQTVPIQTIDEVIQLITQPLPHLEKLDAHIAMLDEPVAAPPPADTPLETAIFVCATHVFLQTSDAGRCLKKLQLTFSEAEFQYLLVFLAFVRTAHFWTKVQTGLQLEDDMNKLLTTHAKLSEALFNDVEAMHYWDNSSKLMETMLSMKEEQKRNEELLKNAVTGAKHVQHALRESKLWLSGQKEAFQEAMNGKPLSTSLDALIRTVEEQTLGEARCAFYMIPPNGRGLSLVTGMNEDYAHDVNGFEVGPESLACGLAMHTGAPVITPDVKDEPLWQPWLSMASKHDYRACWSFPVRTEGGPVLGTFAMYFREPRSPSPEELELAGIVAHAAAIIISRDQEQIQRKKAADILQASEEQLRQLNKQKDDFISIASHELKTPITSIKTYAEILQEEFEDKDDTSSATMMGKINKQIDRLTRLIKDLLDATRIAEGNLPLFLEKIDLNSFIADCIEDLQHVSPNHRILFKSDDEPFVTADKERISQVLTNLISNAVKYSPDGGDVTVSTQLTGNMVRVSVQDHGIGIPKEAQSRVFERFFRVSNVQTQHFSGMGLGLYISAEIIRRHGGSMQLSSEVGKGTTFSFKIPLDH
jgi:signal transduction histidine kinase